MSLSVRPRKVLAKCFAAFVFKSLFISIRAMLFCHLQGHSENVIGWCVKEGFWFVSWN